MGVRTVVERGTKGNKSVAFALDWPGWERGAKTAELALETLDSYRPRYRTVADLAGMEAEFDRAGALDVVEDHVGTGSTDFWDISFKPSTLETEPIDPAELERQIALLRATWAFFDDVVSRVSMEMRAGPRGGGRNRTQIYRHVVRNESEEFAKRVGMRVPDEGALERDSLVAFREEYVDAIRSYNRGDVKKRMQNWNLPYLIRHSAFHTLDHAWEMEDKDLTGEDAA